MFTAVESSSVSRTGGGVCGVGVFRTRQWLSPVVADCMRHAPRMGEMMPANLSDFIICWSWAGKVPNIRLSDLTSCEGPPSVFIFCRMLIQPI